jgi:hypothetical protein
MLAGSERAVSGPNEPPPVGPGHRGQLARLISERPLSVNLPLAVNGFCQGTPQDVRQGAAAGVNIGVFVVFLCKWMAANAGDA